MRNFKAVAYNDRGWTFVFTFQNTNWSGVEAVAQEALDKVVERDGHAQHGPWQFRDVDVAA